METPYYWYKEDRISLIPNPEKEYLLLGSQADIDTLSKRISSESSIPEIKKVQLGSIDPVNDSEAKAFVQEELYWMIAEREVSDFFSTSSSTVLYRGRGFFAETGKELFLTHIFYVKLKSEEDLDLLKAKAEENKIHIEGRNRFMPMWFILSCDLDSKGDSLDMSNLFYESGKFEAVEPDLLEDTLIKCVNDTYFPQQWALSNTGQSGGTPGADIKMCDAWAITQGNAGIIVAVVDQGFELNHPDFSNISGTSFNSESGTSPSQVLGNHATAVAGIIGATRNNNLGVAGIAPLTTLMSVSNSLDGTPNSRMKRADAINFARMNGAAVITNSWGSAVQYQVIDDAIGLALSSGRGGLGCIVIFASGNDSLSAISYPSSLPGVISVGATERNDTRASFSNYGAGLDIAAPGVGIYTTDRQGTNGYNPSPSPAGDYFSGFDGTSAATPHVAGVAALILAVNNTLTSAQVTTILTSSADKVGGYSYDGNGWSAELGFGRLNACRALYRAFVITGSSSLCTPSTYSIGNLPSGISVAWSVSPSNIASISGSGSSVTLSRVGSANGNVTLSATISGSCGQEIISKSIYVGVLTASSLSVWGDLQLSGPGMANFGIRYNGQTMCLSNPYNISQAEWSVSTGESINTGGSMACPEPYLGATIYFSSRGPRHVKVRVQTPCGWSDFSPTAYVNVM